MDRNFLKYSKKSGHFHKKKLCKSFFFLKKTPEFGKEISTSTTGFIIYSMDNELKLKTVLSSGLILGTVGVIGAGSLLFFTYPTIGPRWFFYIFVILAGTGFSLPIFFLANKLLKTRASLERVRLLRESLGMGVYLGFIVWLSIARMLTLPMGLLVLMILVTLDYLMRLRENDMVDASEPSRTSIN